ncbi:glycoside hydrolase family 43 protein [Aurantiacibacter poecillastricola]|uniref:glycoside hydrolase family 43 protein n=1 Tax=Aurantiacibacter poecillastricola TaxID=3064385 RepID=UPI00273FD1ED|nr:glycoside hydrolase family 43 protein [Aurantiacibacter sp. 219JJ12-13]MDP5260247.1 glycoside hydrolase family 43 protein [Aurantiacibacter sp. 219JJ12-13]
MRRAIGTTVATLALALGAPVSAQGEAVFDYVEYEALGESGDLAEGQYANPVIPGFHPDPSLVRVGDDFYAVTSTFSWFPGLPILHSRDLVNWQLLGNAIDRPDQMDFSGLGTNRGLFAPAITHHDGRFWIVNTCIECGNNFVITAESAAGPWSDPTWLEFGGIDPSLYFEGDRAWIVYNDAPPGEPLYEGHRALWIQEFDQEAMQVLPERKLLVNGGVDLSEQPVWAEGPHIYKIGDWYYLLAAEGGTADQHSQTIYRSRNVDGPYEPGPINPILTQRDMPADRPDRVEATGHADMVQLDDGSWWGLFLATRPFEGQSTLLGRETFLLPVQWEDGWPYFLKPGEAVPMVTQRPDLPVSPGEEWREWRDDFDQLSLSPEWITLRSPDGGAAMLHDIERGTMRLGPGTASAGSLARPSFLGRRLRHHEAAITTQVDFADGAPGDYAGMLAFMDEGHFLTAGIELAPEGNRIAVRLRKDPGDAERGELVHSAQWDSTSAQLRLTFREGSATASWRASAEDAWNTSPEIDVEPLASIHAGLFTGVVVGPYAVAGER